MCTYKADENMSYCELYDYHKTVLIATDVKNIMLVTYIISSRKIHLDV